MIANVVCKPLWLRISGKGAVTPGGVCFEVAQDLTDEELPTSCSDDLWFTSMFSLILFARKTHLQMTLC